MRHLIFLTTLLLAANLASSSPIDKKRELVSRDSVELFRKHLGVGKMRVRRSEPVEGVKRVALAETLLQPESDEDFRVRVRRSEQFLKGGNSRVPLTKAPLPPITRDQLGLRKGEFMCGRKVCRLRPDDKPPCDVCQYPIL